MKMRRFAAAVTWVVCTWSYSLRAVDFGEADRLFDERGVGEEAVQRAVSAYEGLAAVAEGKELVYAVEQIGRLDTYLGEWIGDGQRTDDRIKLYEHCGSMIERIRPEALGFATPAYYYFKALCLASWGKAMREKGYAYWIKALQSSKALKSAHDGLLALGEDQALYEGGGVYRVFGVVYYNLPPSNAALTDFKQDYVKAEEYLKKSLRASAHPDSSDPDWDTGEYYISTHYYLADLYSVTQRPNEARQVAEGALALYEDETRAPAKRAPENAVGIRNLRALLARLPAP